MKKSNENYLQLVRNALYSKKQEVSKNEGRQTIDSMQEGISKNVIDPHFRNKKGIFKAKSRIQRHTSHNIEVNHISDSKIVNKTLIKRKTKNGSSKMQQDLGKHKPFSVKTINKPHNFYFTSQESMKLSPTKTEVTENYKVTEIKLPSKKRKTVDDSFITTNKKICKVHVKSNLKQKRREAPELIWHEIPVSNITPDTITNYSLNNIHNDQKIAVKKASKSINSMKSLELSSSSVHDFYDDECVSVKGLKFNKFSTQFSYSPNETQIQQYLMLDIPQKHFNITKADDFDVECTVDNEKFNQNRGKRRNQNKNIKDSKFKRREKVIMSDSVDLLNDNSYVNESLNVEKSIQYDNIDERYATQNLGKHKNQNKKIKDTKVKRYDNSYANDSDNVEENNQYANNEKYTTNIISSESQEPPTDFIKLLDNNKIIILNPGCQTYFHGLCTIKVVNGEIDIFGMTLNKLSGSRKVYSPRGSSLLFIRNKYNLYTEKNIELNKCIQENLLPESHAFKEYNENSSIILCQELNEPYIEFLERHISQRIFTEDLSGPRIDFSFKGIWNKLKISDYWEEVIEDVTEKSKIIVSGGKGVGKSTFLRYSVNTLLQKFRKVRVIDLDSGQSEFTPPGTISVVTVQTDILGPNYTHLQKPEKMIMCHINIGHDIEKYLYSVDHIIKFSEKLQPLPTIVNFPGFTAGFGFDIALNIICLIEPSLLIEIKSKTTYKNYKINLTSENVTKYIDENEIICKDIINPRVKLNYKHVTLESLSENNDAWSLEARQCREICILSYLGKMMQHSTKFLNSHEINMYCINISSLSITNTEGETISPLAVNANLVMLCSLLNSNPVIFNAYGYGFVRGIDLQNDTLVLLTPESLDELDNVSHLILSSVTTPPSLLMSVNDVGYIPYINVGDPIDFGQFTKRSYLPARK
ncbi:polynucleotide 5'-hydroxyl-kinase NOL9 [Sitophilus oryzae]|uniref:Polynucleotide 5'-hydroxyl-kinase NOL9 n=1 Tax=Sitophilus oryzae TaxID=7048 RepID=A0A6J2XNC3_SITOR|nr:polynucleotide 5'-hydroxyl-kinase NOL9 [Sitophilus oryzae]